MVRLRNICIEFASRAGDLAGKTKADLKIDLAEFKSLVVNSELKPCPFGGNQPDCSKMVAALLVQRVKIRRLQQRLV